MLGADESLPLARAPAVRRADPPYRPLDPGGLGVGPALREEDALSEVGAPELAVDAPEVQPRRERQRPVGRLLDRAVPREHEAAGFRTVEPSRIAASASQASPAKRRDSASSSTWSWRTSAPSTRSPESLDAGAGAPSTGSGRSSSGLRRNRRPKPSRPSYQSWLPGMPSSTRSLGSGAHSWVPWPEQTALELVPAGKRIRGIAPEYEDISSRQPPGLLTAERVVGENHAPHGQAHVVVVPGVGYDVDPHGTAEALRERAPGLRCAENAAHSIEKVRPALGPHPVAQVELLAGRGHRHQMSQVAHECGDPEPADRERRMRSAVEPPDPRPLVPESERRRSIGTPSLSGRLRVSADRSFLHRGEG
jgi:hypothetical protein